MKASTKTKPITNQDLYKGFQQNLAERMKVIPRAFPLQLHGNPAFREQFFQLTLQTVAQNPSLLTCQPKSLIAAVWAAARLGLPPDERLCHFVPFKDQCRFIVNYKGWVTIAHRSTVVSNLYAHIVFDDEHFEHELGLQRNLVHRPQKQSSVVAAFTALTNTGRKPICSYAVMKYRDGREADFEVVHADYIARVRAMSKNDGDDSAWVKWEEWMWRKTAIKQLMKTADVPVDDILGLAREVDEKHLSSYDESSGRFLQDDQPDLLEAPGDSNVLDAYVRQQVSELRKASKPKRSRSRAAAHA